jgi:hypothetical protein
VAGSGEDEADDAGEQRADSVHGRGLLQRWGERRAAMPDFSGVWRRTQTETGKNKVGGESGAWVETGGQWGQSEFCRSMTMSARSFGRPSACLLAMRSALHKTGTNCPSMEISSRRSHAARIPDRSGPKDPNPRLHERNPALPSHERRSQGNQRSIRITRVTCR